MKLRPARASGRRALGLAAAVLTATALLPAGAAAACRATRTCTSRRGQRLRVRRRLVAGAHAPPRPAAGPATRRASENSDLTVHVSSGTYRLDKPLELDAADSGTNGHRVVWQGSPGTVVSGGKQVSGWRPVAGRPGLYSAPAPAGLDNTRQLYVDGVRAQRASGRLPVTVKATDTGYTASADTMAHWRNPSDLELVYTSGEELWNVERNGLGQWTEPRCPVASATGTTITMAQPCWDNSTRRVMFADIPGRSVNMVGPGDLTNGRQPSYVENAFELLDTPGEWYLDRAAHTVYYLPRKARTCTGPTSRCPRWRSSWTAAAPRRSRSTTSRSVASSSPTRPGSNRRRRKGSPKSRPATGSPANAAGPRRACASSRPAVPARTRTGRRNPATSRCRTGTGSSSRTPCSHTSARPGSTSARARRTAACPTACSPTSPATASRSAASASPRAAGADLTTRVNVTNNHLYGMPREFTGGVPIVNGYSQDNVVSHNQIDHVAYSGISMGWGGWPDKIKQAATPNVSRNNVVSNNLIHDYMLSLDDGGGIYTPGHHRPVAGRGREGDRERHLRPVGLGKSVYTDNGCTYETVSGNVLYHAAYANVASTHVDYRDSLGNNDPTVISGNYWEQGDPDGNKKGVITSGNHLLNNPAAAPRSIVDNAGIEPGTVRC
ncbi:hypothetical protein ACFPN7_48585 [Amycolatopsis halotolerans]|uniref:hypothetical protein n=1 Tax=Amycolatopsis halotolerans TaxID=330083 RepID=UPI00360B1EF3